MDNEEKKQYLLSWHRILMRHHDAAMVDQIPDQLALKGYREFLAEFFQDLHPLQPKTFFRYRGFNERELQNLRDGVARFSHPNEFDDSLDTSLNIDLEAEIKEILGPNGDKEAKMKFMEFFLVYLLGLVGIRVNPEFIRDTLMRTEENGLDQGLLSMFSKYLDDATSHRMLSITHTQLDIICESGFREKVLDWINKYQGSNKGIRASSFNLCLAEEGDNDAMWGTYANRCEGFCIQYEIKPDSLTGAMILSNLFPIYYGEKEEIKLTELMMNGIFNLKGEKVINGIAQSDYERIHLSSYTKSPIWGFQKEWRVTYGNDHLQPFPFATAIILGENMSETNKKSLIEIAKEKGLSVYQRKLNEFGSKILCEKII